MIETTPHSGAAPVRMSVGELEELVDRLARLERLTDDGAQVHLIETLERVKAAASAAQARVSHALLRTREAGGPLPHRAASVGAEVGLARRESPWQGTRHLDLARALVRELPQTMRALTVGDITERQAMIVAAESEVLTAESRRGVDVALAPHLDGLGDAQLRELVRALTLRADADAASERHRRARAERRVTGRVLRDGTARVTAVVLQEHYAALARSLGEAADSSGASGDPRTPGQVKADVLVERVTGQSASEPVPVAVQLVVGVDSLLGDSPEPGRLVGAGPVPVGLVRELTRRADEAGRATLRRLFALPRDHELVAMESTARRFPAGLGALISLRDGGRCRTPWCDAPIRHRDHVVPVREGGGTTIDNAQGLCETCNHVKESPGWVQDSTLVDGCHEVVTITPAGHVHRSRPPPLVGRPPVPPMSPLETAFAGLLMAG